jgi:hypothetical protein
MVPVMKDTTIEEGQCFLAQPGAQVGEQVEGVSARTLVPNIKCAPALRVYLDAIKKIQEGRLGTLVAPEPEFNPGPLNFALPLPGAVSTQELVVKNLSLLSLDVTDVKTTGEEFVAESDCEGRKVAGQCKIKITYTPRPNGTRRGTLTFNTNTERRRQEVALSVGGVTTVKPTPTPPTNQPSGPAGVDTIASAFITVNPSDPQDFSLQKAGTPSQPRKIIYTNMNNAPVKIKAVSIEGENFSLKSNSCPVNGTLAPGQGCAVEVAYDPKPSGKHSARLLFTASIEPPAGSADSPRNIFREIALSGEAAFPLAEPSDPELCFGRWKKVKPDGPKVVRNTQTFVLTSKRGANVPLKVFDVRLEGENKDNYSIVSDTCKGQTVTGNCRITVGFSPLEAKVKKATLFIKHDGEGAYPSHIQLSGVGKPRNWFLRLFDRLFADKRQTCGAAECEK